MITLIEGRDLEFLLLALGVPKDSIDTYRLRIWPQSDGSVKIKVNERTWSWTVGTKEEVTV